MLTLDAPFSDEEAFQVLRGADGDKTPGPGHFRFRFAQSFWQMFKRDLMDLFHNFHGNVEFDHQFSEFYFAYS